MPSSPSMIAYDSGAALESLAPELIIRIFFQLPTFSDVFALSATCRRLRHVYATNIHPIYGKLAPRNIACLRQARRFHLDQGGSAEEASLSTEDIRSLVRNSHVVEKAISQFGRQIVCRVRSESPGVVRFRVMQEGLEKLTHPSGRLFCFRVLWRKGTTPSTNLDPHRTPTLYTSLLPALGSHEIGSLDVVSENRGHDPEKALLSPRDDETNPEHWGARRGTSTTPHIPG